MRQRTIGTVLTSLFLSASFACFAQGDFSFDQAKRIVQSGDWNGLVQYGTNWSQAQPNNSLAWYCIGKGAFQQHRYNVAVENLQHATQLKPTEAGYWGELGDAYMSQGNRTAAVKAISDGERACGSTMKAGNWYAFGNTLGQAHELDRAKADLNKAIALDPNLARAWTSLGLTEEMQGNRQMAMQYYSKAASLGDATARNSLARFRAPSMRVAGVGMKDPFDARNNPFLNNFLHNPNRGRVPLNNVTERINNDWRAQHPNANGADAPVGGH